MDPREIVGHGYDRIGIAYDEWARGVRGDARERYTSVLLNGLPLSAAVLDLGCGSGAMLTRRLAQQFTVTGVDISAQLISAARQVVPNASLLRADMTRVAFRPGSFDAVAAFYSLTHLPPDEISPLLGAISSWLRPDGLFVASFGTAANTGIVEDGWLGVPMYFAGHDAAAGEQLVRDAGLRIISTQTEVDDEYGQPAAFHWIVARKPGAS